MTILMNLRMKAKTILIVSLFVLFSCQRESDVDSRTNEDFSFLAMFESIPEGSKTVVQEEPHVYWEPGDEIIVFAGTKSSGRFTNTLSEPASSATFSGNFDDAYIPVDGEDLWALYPYSDNAMCNMYSHAITTTIPSEQVARANSFGKDMNITVAHSTSHSFTFYNVGGGVRFSLAEAGVTKVVLKSLGGESIAGRITINTSGEKPSISSISTGYSSITLLPPEGETFETDTWYYFVAIPGTLSEGYTLYYCTNENTGKYYSNESVTIKRSVFGSLEHVDTKAEVQGPIYDFPSTEEEWEASFELASSIASQIENILTWNGYYNGNTDTNDFLPLIGAIDGVSRVFTTAHDEYIVIKQQDGVHFNVPFNYPYVANSNSTQTKSINNDCRLKVSAVTPSNEKKKALLLMPFYNVWNSAREIRADYAAISSQLSSVGYELDVHSNEETDSYWEADSLSKYDLILFATHGGIEGVNTTGVRDGKVSLGTRRNPRFWSLSEVKGFSKKAKLFFWHGFLYDSVDANYYKDSDIQYNKSIVYAMACHSYEGDDFANYFMSHGCSAYCGNTSAVEILLMDTGISDFVYYLTMGASVRDATAYARKEAFFYLPVYSTSETNGPVFLVNPTPINLDFTSGDVGDEILLSWEMPLTTGTYKYDLFWGDGTKIQDDIESTHFSFYLEEPGTYQWYVESQLYDGESPVGAPLRSVIASFTVNPQDFVDLGLSVKWATRNLGAENSADVGKLYAWGETSTKTEFTRANYLWQEKGVYNKYGAEDGYVLELGDDAANVVLGDGARMPTPDEFRELINPNNCDVTWDRIKGITIVSKIEGYEGVTLHLPRTDYWTSVLSSLGSAENAYYFRGDAEPLRIPEFGDDRYKGHYIRPVKSK